MTCIPKSTTFYIFVGVVVTILDLVFGLVPVSSHQLIQHFSTHVHFKIDIKITIHG